MSFPRYPKYKDSGVEWLGKVPAHWEVLSLKKSFKIVGGSTPRSETESFWDGDILWATPSDLSKRESVYINDTQRKITAAGLASCGTTLVPAASIILSTRAPIGSLAIAETAMCTNQGCKSLVPTERADTKYFAHVLSISSVELNIRGKGTTFLEISGDELEAFKTPAPPLPEQIHIAAFLDRETAKINGLVGEQRRLIELLKEKRQAVISHAVTQGLNSHAPMKHSGIEWLGDVPEHWGVGALRNFAKFSTGSTPNRTTEHFWNGGIPWVKTGEINYSTIMTTEETISQEGMASCSVAIAPPGTLLMALYGQGVTRGRVALLGIPSTFNQACAAIQPDERIDGRFLHTFFVFAYPFIREIGNETTQMNLNLEFAQRIRIVVPPILEQIEIADFVEAETAELDTLTAEAQRAIDLLQERRTALISAAVTGQIDVRPH